MTKRTKYLSFVAVITITLIVIVIIPQRFHSPIDTNYAKVKNDIAHLSKAIELYRKDNGSYPSRLQQLTEYKKVYIERLPKDPWGSSYQYKQPGKHNKDSYDLWSFGTDHTVGGVGSDADITNWDSI